MRSYCRYGGDAHFDDSESWSTGRWGTSHHHSVAKSHHSALSSIGTNLFQVAAHEFGHSLGLSHSNVRSSLMAPFYRGYEDNLSLDSDDISAIQDIYGPPSYGKNRISAFPKETRRPPPLNPVIPQPEYQSICESPTIDAITITSDGTTYAFKGDMYYQLTDFGIEKGYPKRISDDWRGLPNNIDAALTWSDGKTFFFKV